jgi:hypothetical protein
LRYHRQKQGTNEEANCVEPDERAREMVRYPATRKETRGRKSVRAFHPSVERQTEERWEAWHSFSAA